MIKIKPKMLKGKINIKDKQSVLFSAGLVLGALGGDIFVKISPEYNLCNSEKYLISVLVEAGCKIKNNKNTFSVSASGVSNSLTVDAKRCKTNICYVIVYLCFLKGLNRIISIKSLSDNDKDTVFSLIDNLRKMGADIVINKDEIVFSGKQVLNGSDVCANSNLEIFVSLFIAAQRCEGDVVINNSGVHGRENDDLMSLFSDLDVEYSEIDTLVEPLNT